jgi:hypothetical protein
LQAAGKKTKIAAILHVKRNSCGRISLEFYKFDEVSWGTKAANQLSVGLPSRA